MLGIFDGHGESGKIISNYISDNFTKNLVRHAEMLTLMNDETAFNYNNINQVTKLINDIYKIVNNNLTGKYKVRCMLSGSTGVSIFMSNNHYYCANVGDSECGFVFTNPKTNKPDIKMVSKTHLPSNPNEKLRIEKNGGKCEPFRLDNGSFYGPVRVWKKNEGVPGLMMTRSFGDTIGHEIGMIDVPDITEGVIDKGMKAVVLGSDGIFEVLTKKQIAEIVMSWYKDEDSAAACRE